MTDDTGAELITQTEAARLRGMTLAAVNEHVRSGRWRSVTKYGKRLVYRADVVGFEPKTHKARHKNVPAKRPAKKATRSTKKRNATKK